MHRYRECISIVEITIGEFGEDFWIKIHLIMDLESRELRLERG